MNTTVDWNLSRFICIADYPRNMAVQGKNFDGSDKLVPHYVKGDIIVADVTDTMGGLWDQQTTAFLEKYPGIFRLLEWHEYRTLDELMSVNFVLVLKNEADYLIGDQVPVIDYEIHTKAEPSKRFGSYILKGNVHLCVDDCMPVDYELLIPR